MFNTDLTRLIIFQVNYEYLCVYLGVSGLLAPAGQPGQCSWVTLLIVTDLQIVGNINEPSEVLCWVRRGRWILTEMRFVQHQFISYSINNSRY